MDKEFVDLLTLQEAIRDGLEGLFPDCLWVRAEIAAISVKANGHCYLELSQNGAHGVVAKARAVIWRSRFLLLSKAFESETGLSLRAGLSVMFFARVSYSEIYGLSLDVADIDSDVTIGENERKRRETVAKLTEDALIDRQAGLVLPQLPYYLAVISAPDAAGFGDFRRHLLENDYGFKYQLDLFEATMQGSGAPASIIDALDAVQTSPVRYDAVLIMRGGGSALDLDCYDDYALCFAIANCPVPVFTAIGHDRDRHVADMVAYSSVKTPTALADAMIDCYIAEDERISSYTTRLKLAFGSKIAAMSAKIDLLESRIMNADPRRILSRGYALALDSRGVVLKRASDVAQGDMISIMFGDGTLRCRVEEKKNG